MSVKKSKLSIFRKNKYILVLTIIISLLVLFTSVRSIALLIKRSINDVVLVEVTPGSSPTHIAEILKDEGVIDSVFFFKLQVRLTGSAPKLKAGVYSFKPGTPIWRAIKKMVNGEVEQYDDIRITIPEGYNIKQMGVLFEEKGLFKADDFYKKAQEIELSYEWAKQIPEGLLWKYEGYLFPDTYDFRTVTTPQAVINKMAARFDSLIATKYADSDLKESYTLHELVSLAAVVEKEAVLDEERATIAGVFYNRLKIGQALQSCATVQYVLPVHREVLTTEDTKTDSIYNTYMHPGLPPGPISSVGIASFKAVLEPKESGYYYFNAIGGGKHYFSKTFDEHLKAIKKYK
ncbi:endolytic transglycosylase MltG [Clostridium sp. 'deep sea']|uniref:endolytic transglycosylase MltG n=1 Tax=Clostridium sp. 'deep sea' TaxID=2779445 RepID=UPI0018964419|nr:endolytic transglycosylase MltG [Clostridium sp. 'deep sea']QOR35705.1 endolytic transglycosylase MltG [Clostridium sp. 'deep sea']